MLILLTPFFVSLGTAVFMTVTICDWAGLAPANFNEIRTCRVTDTPAEVFFSFAFFGFIFGVFFASLLNWIFMEIAIRRRVKA